eukprot:scaffold339130_cov39-Prasinocladus_malaysianus.AAC.1
MPQTETEANCISDGAIGQFLDSVLVIHGNFGERLGKQCAEQFKLSLNKASCESIPQSDEKHKQISPSTPSTAGAHPKT